MNLIIDIFNIEIITSADYYIFIIITHFVSSILINSINQSSNSICNYDIV